VETSKPVGSVSGSHFEGCGEYPVWVKANCVTMLGAGLTFASNAVERIGVDCSALRLRPAVRLLLADRIDVYGRLNVGTLGRPDVVFSSAEAVPAAGDWKGIVLHPGAIANLRQATIQYAENALVSDGGNINLEKCTVERTKYDGVYCGGDHNIRVYDCIFRDIGRSAVRMPGPNLSGAIAQTRFERCGDYPIFLLAEYVFRLWPSNTFVDNVKQRIGVACSETDDLPAGSFHVWKPQPVPLDLTARANESVLGIGKGATLIVHGPNTIMGGGIDVRGNFRCRGEEGKAVTLTAAAQPAVPGSWEGVKWLTC